VAKTKSLLIISSVTLLVASCSKEETANNESAAWWATAAKPYPLEVCLVSGEKIGSMGEPTSLVHEGQEIKFCCDHCEPKFKKDPAKYLSKLEKP
jgi:YHS domain-containing protein